MSSFCSQECVKACWKEHKKIHKEFVVKQSQDIGRAAIIPLARSLFAIISKIKSDKTGFAGIGKLQGAERTMIMSVASSYRELTLDYVSLFVRKYLIFPC